MGDEKNERVIAIGSDHAGFRIKEIYKEELTRRGYDMLDMGTDSEESCDYPDFAQAVAEAVSVGDASKGVLVCGTGAGMAMAANKVPGVRAAVCNDPYTAQYCRLHNDANVLTLGARVVDEDEALRILGLFLDAGFEGGRHSARVEKIGEIERKYTKER
jgi:ribose 5-phosphate isomerase B